MEADVFVQFTHWASIRTVVARAAIEASSARVTDALARPPRRARKSRSDMPGVVVGELCCLFTTVAVVTLRICTLRFLKCDSRITHAIRTCTADPPEMCLHGAISASNELTK